MITLLIGIFLACGSFAALHFVADCGYGWSIAGGLGTFVAFQALFGMWVRKRIQKDMEAVQNVLAAGQKRLQEKTRAWQFRPPGSVKEAQRLLFEETKGFVRQALDETHRLDRYRLWVPMIDRQAATARLQLNWMIKNFDAVDELMPKVLLVDPTMAAIKMARMYMRGEETATIRKVYDKAVMRARYNGNVLPAALMSWIEVNRNDVDAAFKTLTEALKKSDDATLKRNHEVLMNNRAAQFTNSGLGDQWFALHLEEPKIRTQRQHQSYR